MHANHDQSSHQIILFKNGIISFFKYILLYLGSVHSSNNINHGIYIGFFGILVSCNCIVIIDSGNLLFPRFYFIFCFYTFLLI
jgi:hypothetical protein